MKPTPAPRDEFQPGPLGLWALGLVGATRSRWREEVAVKSLNIEKESEAAGASDFPAEWRVHEVGGRNGSDAAEIEAISIPAGADGEVVGEVSIRVPGAGIDELLHRDLVQVE